MFHQVLWSLVLHCPNSYKGRQTLSVNQHVCPLWPLVNNDWRFIKHLFYTSAWLRKDSSFTSI